MGFHKCREQEHTHAHGFVAHIPASREQYLFQFSNNVKMISNSHWDCLVVSLLYSLAECNNANKKKKKECLCLRASVLFVEV